VTEIGSVCSAITLRSEFRSCASAERIACRIACKAKTTQLSKCQENTCLSVCLIVNIVSGRRTLGLVSRYPESKCLSHQNRCYSIDTHRHTKLLSQQGIELATSISIELTIPNNTSVNGNINSNERFFFLLSVHVYNINY
jgi:hypothetical protein